MGRQLLYILWGDFLERIRRPSFRITLAILLFGAFFLLPDPESGIATMRVGGHRGLYNSAWVGANVALWAAFFFSIGGFFLVRGSVERDESTGVGQILATTPMTRPAYTLGKWMSNSFFLTVMTLVVLLFATLLQLWRGEVREVELWPLISPFIVIAIPMITTVSSLAIFFDVVPWLRHTLGSVIYFFLWMMGVVGLTQGDSPGGFFSPSTDLLGVQAAQKSMLAALHATVPTAPSGWSMGGISRLDPGNVFTWPGFDWTAAEVASHLWWILIAVGIALCATLPFRRFDPTRERAWHRSTARPPVALPEPQPELPPPVRQLTPLQRAGSTWGGLSLFGVTLLAEVRMMQRGTPLWWYLAAGGCIAGSLGLPLTEARQFLLPLTWALLIFRLAETGSRAELYRTAELTFSAPYPIHRQLPATYVGSVILTMVLGTGFAIRFWFGSDWGSLLVGLVGALFVPALALALGVWTGGTRAFELVYLLLLYASLNSGPAGDFLGRLPDAAAAGAPTIYGLCTVALLIAAATGRHFRLKS